ncbi:hypothetical protein NVS55_09140 [Myxococcus stipitatus]|uniref:hypothetical protein n=1 Tax=Myxococcus stipitatus TaxID=83455 RepID=UPI0031452A87
MAGFALAAGIADKNPPPQASPTPASLTASPLEVTATLPTPHAVAAAPVCWSTTDSGSSTEFLLKSMYTNSCAFVSRNCNGVTCRFTSNCCAASTWIRVNQGDWERLRDSGMLSGLRYQMIPWNGTSYSVIFKRLNGPVIEVITPGEFLP